MYIDPSTTYTVEVVSLKTIPQESLSDVVSSAVYRIEVTNNSNTRTRDVTVRLQPADADSFVAFTSLTENNLINFAYRHPEDPIFKAVAELSDELTQTARDLPWEPEE